MHNIYYYNIELTEINLSFASLKEGLIYVGINVDKEKFQNNLNGFTNYKLIENRLANEEAIRQMEEYLKGKRKEFSIPFIVKGTEFEKNVWAELLKIPYGTVVSYKDIAIGIDKERAYRAVGMASNKNRLPIIIPCHRVVGSNGSLIGYAGGLDIKRKLLALEGVNSSNDKIIW